MGDPIAIPASIVTNVEEFEEVAKGKLPKMVYDYYASGAEDQWTLKENRHAFERIRFRPRILIDVSKVDTSTTVLGHKISMPIMVAASAMHKMAHPEGELATARATAAHDTIMTLSSSATTSVEEVASTSPGAVRFFQLYFFKDRDFVERLVHRAERAGFQAIALTCDTPIMGRREADIKNNFNLPSYLSMPNVDELYQATVQKKEGSGIADFFATNIDRRLSWGDVSWLKTITKMPILLKGVLTAEDTRLAVKCGADGIIVSNHGARQLDYAPGTISVLEEVVRAAEGRLPVLFDGGVRRGTDALKALALGAAGVFVGRPVLWGLASDGEAGVHKVLQILREEFTLAMALSGCVKVSDIKRSHVSTEAERMLHGSRL